MADRTRLGPEPLDEDDFADICRSLIDEAEDWTDTNLRSPAAEAWRRYHGEADAVDQEPLEGGSELVISEVRDTALGIMPDLMELFAGSDKVVEYYDEGKPAGPPPVPGMPPPAPKLPPELATEHANDVFWSCGGWRALNDLIADAVVAQIGWGKCHRPQRRKMMRLPPMDMDALQLEGLMSSDDIQVDGAEEIIRDGMEQPLGYKGLKLRRYYLESRIMLEAVPAEKMIVTDCADPEHARLIGERREVRLGELVAMGIEPDELGDLRMTDSGDGEDVRRRRSRQDRTTPDSHGHWSLEPTVIYEVYPLIDEDGDGLPERWRVLLAGPQKKLLRREVVEDHPYVAAAAWLVPHRLNGLGLGEMIADLQEARTKIVRAILDNSDDINEPTILAARTGVDHNALVARRREKVVSCQHPGLVSWLQSTPLAGQLLPVNELLDQIRESRTGQSRIAQGLDPDALQNTTATAAMGTLGAAQRKQEMVARSLAEIGLKGLFRKLLRLLIEEGPVDRPQPGGPAQRVDPAGYDVTWGTRVCVGLGHMRRQELRQFYTTAYMAGSQIAQQLGPDNPLCGLQHLSTMLTDWAGLYPGVRPDRLFGSPPQVQAWLQQRSQQPPPPDPKMVEAQQKAQTAQQKMQLDAQSKQAKMGLDTQKAQTDAALKTAELQTKAGLEAQKLYTQSTLQRDKQRQDMALRLREQEIERELAQQALRVKAATGATNTNIKRD